MVCFALSLTLTLCVLILPVRIILEILERILCADVFCAAAGLIRTAEAAAALLLEATGTGSASLPTAAWFHVTETWFSLEPGAVSAKPAVEKVLMLPATDKTHRQLWSTYL